MKMEFADIPADPIRMAFGHISRTVLDIWLKVTTTVVFFIFSFDKMMGGCISFKSRVILKKG